MAIAFRAKTSTAGLATPSITIPATVQAGDVMLLAALTNGNTLNFTSPTGWTLLTSALTTSGAKAAVWWKVATVSDPGSTVLVATDGGGATKTIVEFGAWSGTDTTSPIMAFATFAESTTQASHTSNPVTTTAANAQVVGFCMGKDTGGTAWTPPSGFTLQDSLFGGGSGQVTGALADRAAPTTGSYGSGTWTETGTTSANVVTYTIALAPLTATSTVRPASDVTTAGWTSQPAQGVGDSYASRLADGSDTTYVSSPTNPTTSVFEAKLAVPAGPLTQIKHRGYASGGATSMTIVTALYMGATLIASFTETAIVTAPTDFVYSLNSAQQAAQTDLTNLRIRVTATVA